MTAKQPEAVARKAGISLSYINAHGQAAQISPRTQQRLLAAMHPQPDQAPAFPPVAVFTRGDRMQLRPRVAGKYHWRLTTESGEQITGEGRKGAALTLPDGLAEGYHHLEIVAGDKPWACRIIVAPPRCYEPPEVVAGQRLWGACIQLYTLRSEQDWGVGDFGCLKQMLGELAPRGAAYIGLNPIHALFPAVPDNASPYSPSSRRWLNIIYIDVYAVDDFKQSAQAQDWWQQPQTRLQLREVRAAENVDYRRVMALKLTALDMAWQQFLTRLPGDEVVADFNAFIARGGESLYYQAMYDALHAWLIQQDPNAWGWPVWPEAYRDLTSPALVQFAAEHQQTIRFYLWLQYLADSQFRACWQKSQALAMPIGLYRDLAVGVAQGGMETWHDRSLYCLQASVGAPPDILGPQGQNWGLPPLDPHVMANRGYQPFIDLLRANMAHCGALRIDHVMSLLRLWWIPYGETADQGAYVHYPVDDLLAILALESQRHRCMVIGEDLGTVPEEIIGKLHTSGVYSYKVLYFEHDDKGRFHPPQAWPVQAMAVATTHDLPTLRGYWNRADLALGETLGLYPNPVILAQLYQDRARDKQGMLDSLHQFGCVPKRTGHRASLTTMTGKLSRGMQRYIASSRSALLGLQPEDWLEMAKPVNVPGTSDEYPNWRRKLRVSLQEMFADKKVNTLLKDINRRRKRS